MKVLFVIKNIHNAKGGAEKILCDLATYLAESNSRNEVVILSFDGPSSIPFYEVSDRVKLKALERKHAQKRTTVLNFIKRIIVLRRTIKEMRPSVIVSFMHSSMAITGLANLGLNIPFVGSEHIVKEHYKNKPLEYMLLLLSIALSDVTTVISETIKSSFPILKNKLTVLSNPVSFSSSVIWPDRDDNKVLLTVGRLESQKNHEILIRAMKIVQEEYPDWVLRIFGEGSIRLFLEALVDDLQIKNVHFMGISRNLHEEFLKSDIFIFPSRYESFGLALAESLSAGLPAIGFKSVEGVDGLIKHGVNGLLVDSHLDDVQELAKVIVNLISSKDSRKHFSRSACNSVFQNHPLVIFPKWESLLKKVTKVT